MLVPRTLQTTLRNLIAGEWRDAAGGGRFPVEDPIGAVRLAPAC